ncbi:hypothetical protein L1987_64849 [Smallanthus sonchifolius]|uniref:Uncharacterized protein n=1 Tax=Smallanthus sonchifolius TaxID=185202 RepID=A0ACB9BSR5_9ASTR|nr:hypothetical protein L1987_64849 [Smallanthus sonchifolius]
MVRKLLAFIRFQAISHHQRVWKLLAFKRNKVRETEKPPENGEHSASQPAEEQPWEEIRSRRRREDVKAPNQKAITFFITDLPNRCSHALLWKRFNLKKMLALSGMHMLLTKWGRMDVVRYVDIAVDMKSLLARMNSIKILGALPRSYVARYDKRNNKFQEGVHEVKKQRESIPSCHNQQPWKKVNQNRSFRDALINTDGQRAPKKYQSLSKPLLFTL